MPHRAVALRGRPDPALIERLAALRTELELPAGFPPEVLEEADAAARDVLAALASDPAYADRTDVPFVTVDPAGSTDLDQALHLEEAGAGRLTVRKIADYQLHLYARADLVAGLGRIRSIDDLAALRGIGYISDMIFDKEIDYLAEIGAETVSFGSNSVAVQFNWVASVVSV